MAFGIGNINCGDCKKLIEEIDNVRENLQLLSDSISDEKVGDYVLVNGNDGDGILRWEAPVLDKDGNPTGEIRFFEAPEPIIDTTNDWQDNGDGRQFEWGGQRNGDDQIEWHKLG